MFGQPRRRGGTEVRSVPILTIEHYPGKDFEPLGLVTVRYDDLNFLKMPDESKVEAALQRVAADKGADAVIGVRMFLYSGASVIGYGTAIRFK